MKKIPTLFEREFANHRVVGITDKITPGMEWVLEGKGIATEKIDGSCCAVIDGALYKRYDAKRGKKAPEGAIPCCDPDPITGHHPHWVKVNADDPADKWFISALSHSIATVTVFEDRTYEAIGPHFNGNPHKFAFDMLIPHGETMLIVDRSFDGIREYLRLHNIEGMAEQSNTLDCMHDQQAVIYPGVGITSTQNASNPQPGDPCCTLSTDSRNYAVIPEQPPRKYIVRRLTPLECCRLQGFPDSYLDGVEGSDSAKYKLWGNGMALPNMLHVMKGIARVESQSQPKEAD